jgi:hypothetical protein
MPAFVSGSPSVTPAVINGAISFGYIFFAVAHRLHDLVNASQAGAVRRRSSRLSPRVADRLLQRVSPSPVRRIALHHAARQRRVAL